MVTDTAQNVRGVHLGGGWDIFARLDYGPIHVLLLSQFSGIFRTNCAYNAVLNRASSFDYTSIILNKPKYSCNRNTCF